MTDITHPLLLERAGAWRTYLGGSLIRALHGETNTPDDHFPEEWIMSAVRARNPGREEIVEGLSRVRSTSLTLAELIEANPSAMLGAEHVRKYGSSMGVLVKLLDAAERLTVQVHPTREEAMRLFGSPFGKTECWHILNTRAVNGETPCIYFGFKEGITREQWKALFDQQDIDGMLACLHRFAVKPGDTFLIEGGIPHAIGAGCFLVEIQEPTDYTIRTERMTPSGLPVSDFSCHQGLGFDKMFDCFIYGGYSEAETLARWRIPKTGRQIIGAPATSMFTLEMEEIRGSITLEGGGVFSGVYILDGEGTLDGKTIKAGDQAFIPASCPAFTLSGSVRYMRYFGPV